MAKGPLYRSLYAQVLAGITLGIGVGLLAPETGAAMRPLGDGFIKLIRRLIGPIVLVPAGYSFNLDGLPVFPPVAPCATSRRLITPESIVFPPDSMAWKYISSPVISAIRNAYPVSKPLAVIPLVPMFPRRSLAALPAMK
jgi:hypothetical protein